MEASKYGKSEYFINNLICNPGTMQFHSSWDWLMPIIDKIYSSNEYFKYKGTLGQFNEGIVINTKFITVTHESVVEFIKWFNEQK